MMEEQTGVLGSPQHESQGGFGVGQDGSDEGSVCRRVEPDGCFRVWAKLARTRCPIREPRWLKEWFFGEPRWLGQVVQFGGQDDSGQEGMVLGRPQPGGLLFVSSLEGLRPRGYFWRVPKWRTRCPYGVKGQGLGCPQPGRSGSRGKGMLGRLVGESPTFLHANLTLRADPAVSAQSEKNETSEYRDTGARFSHHASAASV